MNTLAKDKISSILKNAFSKAAAAGLLADAAGFDIASLTGAVEVPRDAKNGDFAATHALAAAKKLGVPPRSLAGVLAENIELDGTYFGSVSVAGPGFINFTLSQKWYAEALRVIENEGEAYGASDSGRGERVMIEFVSANPTGPMTIGNARGGVLGDALASVLSRAGYDVRREFYVNDAGNQVALFGKSVDARYMQLVLGENAVEFPEKGYQGEDIKELARLIFDENGDSLAALPEEERVRRFIAFGIPRNTERMKLDLERYGINYDTWFLESSLHASGYVDETVELLIKSGLTYEKDGALWLRNTDFGAEKDEVLRRSDGFYSYDAVDIAYHRNKFAERGFDRVINVLGADHHGHTIRFGATMSAPALREALGIKNGKLEFRLMQMVRLTRGGETVKVSKRTGKAITLSDLLDEISVDACRFFFNAKPDNHLEFDLDLAIRQDSENPVYYVQYAHARICSLIRALAAEGFAVKSVAELEAAPSGAQLSALSGEFEKELIKQLALLPDELALAARELDPSRVNRYVTELATRFHKFYTACRIKGEVPDILSARLKLADLTRGVIKNCLTITGVSAPEKM
jgi:arginyl-tRNA synthetase